jgi:rubrerythrin
MKFQKELTKMLRDEKKAPRDYLKLKSLAHTKGERKVIAGIIKDERGHYSKLNKIKKHCRH